MVPAVQQVNTVCLHAVHESVLDREPPGPKPRAWMFQRFRLANPGKGIPAHGLYELQQLAGDLS